MDSFLGCKRSTYTWVNMLNQLNDSLNGGENLITCLEEKPYRTEQRAYNLDALNESCLRKNGLRWWKANADSVIFSPLCQHCFFCRSMNLCLFKWMKEWTLASVENLLRECTVTVFCPVANMAVVYLQHSPFFTEQLTAFQVWLAMGAENRDPPEQLPIVLQVLLSQVHRLRALDLLGRFLDLGPWAVNLVSWHGIKHYYSDKDGLEHFVSEETVVPCWWQVFGVKQVDMGHIAMLKVYKAVVY